MIKSLSSILFQRPFVITGTASALALLAIFYLSIPTFCGGTVRLPPSARLTSGPGTKDDRATSATAVNSAGSDESGLSGAAALSLSVAERNTAWATYVVTVVGILFTAVVILTTLWNEIRYAFLMSEWQKLKIRGEKLRAGIKTERKRLTDERKELAEYVKLETDRNIKRSKQEISYIALQIAEFMVQTAVLKEAVLKEKELESRESKEDQPGREYTTVTACEGVKLLVRYEEKYTKKGRAVRRLSRFISPLTRDYLDEIERMVRMFEPGSERDNLVDVIHTTRDVVREALRLRQEDLQRRQAEACKQPTES